MKKLIIAFLSVILLLFIGRNFVFDLVNSYLGQQHTITIFVHGSRSPARFYLSQYRKSKYGLHAACEYDDNSLYCEIADSLTNNNNPKYNKEHFYVFGWSGAINFSVRRKMAKKLYRKTVKLINFYKKKYGCYPKVQIVTFSHGGNITLQLADFLPFFDTQKINLDLILIGCPVQATTEHMIGCPHFSTVSVISSYGDVIQRMDPHNWYAPKRDKKTHAFSRRFFDVSHLDEKLQEKIVQYAVTVNRKKPGHIDLSKSFMSHIPYVLEQRGRWSSGKILEIDIFDPNFVFSNFYSLFW